MLICPTVFLYFWSSFVIGRVLLFYIFYIWSTLFDESSSLSKSYGDYYDKYLSVLLFYKSLISIMLYSLSESDSSIFSVDSMILIYSFYYYANI